MRTYQILTQYWSHEARPSCRDTATLPSQLPVTARTVLGFKMFPPVVARGLDEIIVICYFRKTILSSKFIFVSTENVNEKSKFLFSRMSKFNEIVAKISSQLHKHPHRQAYTAGGGGAHIRAYIYCMYVGTGR